LYGTAKLVQTKLMLFDASIFVISKL